MYELEPARPQPKPDSTTTLVDDRPCLKCGYSLKGLPLDGVCPECSTSVPWSLREDLLKHCSIEYVSRLRNGARLIVLSIIGIVLGILFGAASLFLSGGVAPGVSSPWAGSANDIYNIAIAALSLVGWWLLTTPNPATLESARVVDVRLVTRAAVVFSAGSTALSFIFLALFPTAAGSVTSSSLVVVALGAVSSIAFAVKYFASLLYVRRLSRRLPNDWLIKRAKRLIIMAPALIVVWFIAGSLIAISLLSSTAAVAMAIVGYVIILISLVLLLVVVVMYVGLMVRLRSALGATVLQIERSTELEEPAAI